MMSIDMLNYLSLKGSIISFVLIKHTSTERMATLKKHFAGSYGLEIMGSPECSFSAIEIMSRFVKTTYSDLRLGSVNSKAGCKAGFRTGYLKAALVVVLWMLCIV